MAEREPLSALLRDALDILRREVPSHYDAIVRVGAGLSMQVETPGEHFSVEIGMPHIDGVVVSHEPRTSLSREERLQVQLDRKAIAALVDGREDILDQLRSGRLQLRAPVAALGKLDAALRWYLHGAVRSQGHRAIVSRLSQGATEL